MKNDRTLSKWFILFALAFAAISIAAASFGGGSRTPSRIFKSEWLVRPAISYQNLQIFPIVPIPGFPLRNTDGYITLDEGLKNGTVTITETSTPTPMIRNRPPAGRGGGVGYQQPSDPQGQSADIQIQNQSAGQQRQQTLSPQQGRGAQVNTLYVLNKSGKKLILLAGEMVVGGQQDRIIQKDGIVPPSDKPFDLSVFCVEQGRWTANSSSFKPADNAIVKGGAGGGGLGAVADPTIRGTAQAERSQSGVWAKVGEKNKQVNANPSSGTYQATVSSPKAQKDAKPYNDAILMKMPRNAVGAVIAIHGELVWVDAFPSADLFQAYWPKLLQSYIVDAMTASPPIRPADERIPRVLRGVPSVDAAQKYLDDRSGKSTFEGQTDVYRLTRIDAPNHLIFELWDLGANPDLRMHFNKMKKGR